MIQNNTSFQTLVNDRLKYLEMREFKYSESDISAVTKIFKYQEFPADLLEKFPELPGMYLYVDMGMGKTLMSILAAEKRKKQTIVISPASLKKNYREELMKHFPLKYKENEDIDNYYKFFSFNAPNTLEQYESLYLSDGNIRKKSKTDKIEKHLGKILKNKFDGKTIIIDEAHEAIHHVVSQSAKQFEQIYEKIYNSKNSCVILLSGTPISSQPFEIGMAVNLIMKKKVFPTDDIRIFNNYFVDKENKRIKDQSAFMNRINGIFYYFKRPADPERFVMPHMDPIKLTKVSMGIKQFEQYLVLRSVEIEAERRSKFATKEFEVKAGKLESRKGSMTYKIKSRQACLYVIPKNIGEFIETTHGITYIDLLNYKINEYNMDKIKMIMKSIPDNMIRENIRDMSTKFEYVINEIRNWETVPGLVLVCIDFKSAAAVFGKCLSAINGYEEYIPVVETKSKRKPKSGGNVNEENQDEGDDNGGDEKRDDKDEIDDKDEKKDDKDEKKDDKDEKKNKTDEKKDDKDEIDDKDEKKNKTDEKKSSKKSDTSKSKNVERIIYPERKSKFKYAIIDGTIDAKRRDDIKGKYNNPLNVDKSLIYVLIVTSAAKHGVSFNSGTRQFVINSQWKVSDYDQYNARLYRTGAHRYFVNREFRKITAEIVLASIPKKFRAHTGTDGGISSEEIMHNNAREKQKLIDSFYQTIQSASVNCDLHKEVNKIACRVCKPDSRQLFDDSQDITENKLLHELMIEQPCKPQSIEYAKLYPFKYNGKDLFIDLDLNVFEKTGSAYEQVMYYNHANKEYVKV